MRYLPRWDGRAILPDMHSLRAGWLNPRSKLLSQEGIGPTPDFQTGQSTYIGTYGLSGCAPGPQ
jgi:hypothetical protein